MVCDTLPFKDAYTHQTWNFYLKEYKRYVLDTKILQTRSEVEVKATVTQGHSDQKMVCDTSSSNDAFTHQIQNSYLKE